MYKEIVNMSSSLDDAKELLASKGHISPFLICALYLCIP